MATCKDCFHWCVCQGNGSVYYSAGADHCSSWADPTKIAPRWIPVAERMPNEGERVLAFYQDGVQRVLCTDCFGFPMVHTKDLVWVMVTHWMQLPDPPKEGK